MDIQTLIDNFATIAEVPGGVQRLRELVLQLAVAGRLVEQSEEDGPASAGLGAVRAEKGNTLADSIRGGSSVPRIPSTAERSHDLPSGWEWARVDDTGEYVNGLAFKNADWRPVGIPIIRIQNLTNPSVPFNYADGPFPEDRMARDGDILVSWSATLNAFRWRRGDAVVNQHIFKVIPDYRVVTTDFLFHLLRHCIHSMAESEAAHGLVMKHINRGPFLSHVVALPPLAEQERIVAKVDELMALCDELEARQEHRHRATAHFRASALHTLTEAETPGDLRHAWERVSSNWPDLTDDHDSVPEIRQAVLELAFRGALVDGVSTGTGGRGDLSIGGQSTRSSGGPFEVPAHWTWTRFEEVAESRLGKMLDKAKNTGPFRPYLRNANVQWFRFNLSDVHELRLEDRDLEAHVVRLGDLVICEGGEPGRVAVCDSSVDGMVIQKALHRARPRPGVDVWFLAYLLRCYASNGYLSSFFTGATIKHLTGKALGAVPVPVPPLAEQQQIVRRIEALMAGCDRLEDALSRRSCEHNATAAALAQTA